MLHTPSKTEILREIEQRYRTHKSAHSKSLAKHFNLSHSAMRRLLNEYSISILCAINGLKRDDLVQTIVNRCHHIRPKRNQTAGDLFTALGLKARPDAEQLLLRAGVAFKKRKTSLTQRVRALNIDTALYTPKQLAVMVRMPRYKNPASSLSRAAIPYSRYKISSLTLPVE